MPRIARGEENTISNINWFTTVGGVLTDMYSTEYRIFNIEAGLPGTQIFPSSGWEDVTSAPGRFEAGSYYAYDNGNSRGWTPELTASLGTHRINWQWKLGAGSVYQEGYEDFELIGAPIVTQSEWLVLQDLYNNVGVDRVVRLFDDNVDGDLVEEDAQVQRILSAAEDEVASRLLRNWTHAQILSLASVDQALRSHAAWIALEFASERRPEFCADDGKGAFWAQYERAIAFFESISKSNQRSKGEATAGVGANLGGRLRPTETAKKASSFVFAPSEEAPTGHGGY